MKFTSLTAVLLLSLVIGSCSHDESTPSVESLSINRGRVAAGTTVTVSVSYRVAAPDTGSEVFSSVLSIPAGASLVGGTSRILFQATRDPDAQGTCQDGRTWVLYNFREGEFENSLSYNPMIAVIAMDITLQAPANKGKLVAGASPATPSDPCGPLTGDSITFDVKG